MLDIHTHILPEVDDGSKNIEETQKMLQKASETGVQSIIATPHLQSINKYDIKIEKAYDAVGHLCENYGIRLIRGYECHHRVLLDHSAHELWPYCIGGTNVILLEFYREDLPLKWQTDIQSIQKAGMSVIIAHPERYRAIQKHIEIAERMIQMGCELQISADCLIKSPLSQDRRCANKLLKNNMISYIASDAHSLSDYETFAKIATKYSRYINCGKLLRSLIEQQGVKENGERGHEEQLF